MPLPVTVVASGGLPVVDANSFGRGLPVISVANGLPVTVVGSYGLPVVGLVLGPPTGTLSALEAGDTALIIGSIPSSDGTMDFSDPNSSGLLVLLEDI
jgi:hypothetical protein